ncbi:MAG: hypothetical protein HQ498_09250, partial [Pseudohongiella sp.]|nr:hypothetical protein [Pseudohongiella sp.]
PVNPLAPSQRPPNAPPPMLSPSFYSQTNNNYFDMTIVTAGTSFSGHSASLTAAYDAYTSTSAISAPLPSGMSFDAPPVGVPLSGYTSVDGIGESGGGESVDVCVANPNSVMCSDEVGFIADMKAAFNDLAFGTFDYTEGLAALPSEDQSVSVLTPVSLASAVCPEPPSITIMGNVYSFENSYVCTKLALLHPIMILIATFSAAMLIAGATSKA